MRRLTTGVLCYVDFRENKHVFFRVFYGGVFMVILWWFDGILWCLTGMYSGLKVDSMR